MSNKNFGFGTQIRKSPYFDSTVKWGATGFSVYNHMYIPRDFGSPEQNFWNLIEKSILCDVAVERQVEICLLYTSPSPRDVEESRMPSSA